MDETYLTRREAADIFRVHVKTIGRWQREGRLHAYHVGPRSIRYALSELKSLFKGSIMEIGGASK